MKHLLYKEFKLAVPLLSYLLIVLLAMSALSPSFPSFVPLLYMGATYTFLFIGMNKTTTTNDLYYTCTLPIRREDVIKARVGTLTVIQFIEIFLVFAFMSVSTFIFDPANIAAGGKSMQVSLNMYQPIALLAVYLVSYSVYDIIYLPWFYKNGKSIIANMLVGILSTSILAAGLTIGLFLVAKDPLTVGHPNANYFLQFGLLLGAIAIYIGVKVLVIKLSTKNLKKLDF